MKKNGLRVCVLAAALALASTSVQAAAPIHTGPLKTPAWLKAVAVFTAVCATGIIGAALAKNSQQNKPLTASEATSCGWRFWVK